MQTARKHQIFKILVVLFAVSWVPVGASAEQYPAKPIHMVLPFVAGGLVDIVARTIGQEMSEAWKRPVIVENRVGAFGNVGTDFVARAAPDGYTILVTQISMALNVSLFEKLPYEPSRDFAPVSLAATTPLVLIANPSLPLKSVEDAIKAARSQPGVMNYSSAGYGTLQHISMELFKRQTGADIVHIPFKGSPAAMTSLVSGRVQFMMSDLASALPQIKAGKVIPLATTSPARLPSVPDVPTFTEQGFPGLNASVWIAVFVPSKTPAPIINKVSSEIARIVAKPDVAARFASLNVQPVGSTPAALKAHVQSETDRWSEVIKAAKIRMD